MPPALVKAYAKKTGKSEAEIEKYWQESKDAADSEKAKGDDAFYGTAVKILKSKLRKHAGLKEGMSLRDYLVDEGVINEEEKFNGYLKVDKKKLALIELFQKETKIKDHRDIHALAEKLGLKEPAVLEEMAYAMLQSFWSQGRAMEKGMDFEVDEEEVKMGMKVELEHTDCDCLAYRIALDHLAELPDYYTRLAKMENEGKAK
jgi:hypothetical protein